jgi:hypothetical protein
MAFDLSTPAAQLAWETATRTAEAEAAARKYIEEQTAMKNAATLIAPYGGNIADYTSQLGASDAAARQQADRLGAMRNYVVGLPELLVKSAREKRKTGTGGGATTSGYNPTWSVQDMMNYLLPQRPATTPTVARTGTADTAGRTSTAAPVRARRLGSGTPARSM